MRQFFKAPKTHVYKLIGKEISASLGAKAVLIWTFALDKSAY